MLFNKLSNINITNNILRHTAITNKHSTANCMLLYSCKNSNMIINKRHHIRPMSTLNYNSSNDIKPTTNPIISVAPMVDVTDLYFRYMCRLLSKHIVLYTPMLTDLSLLKDPNAVLKHLQYDPSEHYLVVQLGGSSPDSMSSAAKLCESLGFDEININLGCPASSAQSSCYGATLVHDQPNVFEICKAVKQAVQIPVSVKLRTSVYNTPGECNAISDDERYEWLYNFVSEIHRYSNITRYILHCRPAILKFRPDKNRTAPVLNHGYAYKLKQDFPLFNIQINGEINSIDDIQQHLSHGVDGCMLGRSAWRDTYLLHQIDTLYGDNSHTSKLCRYDIIQQYVEYAEKELDKQLQLQQQIPTWKPLVKNILNPLLHLFTSCKSASEYRIILTKGIQNVRSYYIHKKSVEGHYKIRDIVNNALSKLDDYVLYNVDQYRNLRSVSIALNPNRQNYVPVNARHNNSNNNDTQPGAHTNTHSDSDSQIYDNDNNIEITHSHKLDHNIIYIESKEDIEIDNINTQLKQINL